jgi:hypothetical protein
MIYLDLVGSDFDWGSDLGPSQTLAMMIRTSSSLSM